MKQLTEGELEVMQVLWEHGEQKPSEIQERFPRSISNMALRSVLQVLTEKGHTTRRRIGKAYYYRSRTPRDRAMKKMTQRMAQVFAEGSSFALIAKLIETEKFSEEDIRELQKIASGKIRKKASGKGKGQK